MPRDSQTRRWASSISRSTSMAGRLMNLDERSTMSVSKRRRSAISACRVVSSGFIEWWFHRRDAKLLPFSSSFYVDSSSYLADGVEPSAKTSVRQAQRKCGLSGRGPAGKKLGVSLGEPVKARGGLSYADFSKKVGV